MNLDRFSQPFEQEFGMIDDLSFITIEDEQEEEMCAECGVREPVAGEDFCRVCIEA